MLFFLSKTQYCQHFRHVRKISNVYSIAIDKQGNKWFGTYDGISKFDGINWTNYRYNGDKIKGIAGTTVLSIAIDNQGINWFGTWGGISEFDGTNWINHDNETVWLKAGSPVLSAAIDSSGNKWFGSNGWGISELNGSQWITYEEANGQKIAPVYQIAIDSNGNKWFCTAEGLIKFEDKN